MLSPETFADISKTFFRLAPYSHLRPDWFYRMVAPFLTKNVFTAEHGSEISISEIQFAEIVFTVERDVNDKIVLRQKDGDAYIEIHAYNFNDFHDLIFQNLPVSGNTISSILDSTVLVSGSMKGAVTLLYESSVDSGKTFEEHFHQRRTVDGTYTSHLFHTKQHGFRTRRLRMESRTLHYWGISITLPVTPFLEPLGLWIVRACHFAQKPGIETFKLHFLKDGSVITDPDLEPWDFQATFTATTEHDATGRTVRFHLGDQTVLEVPFFQTSDGSFVLHGPLNFDLRGEDLFHIKATTSFTLGRPVGHHSLEIDTPHYSQTFKSYMNGYSMLHSLQESTPALTSTRVTKATGTTETTKQWMQSGVLHRNGAPAYEYVTTGSDGSKETTWAYFCMGLKHRTNGPQHSSQATHYANDVYPGYTVEPLPKKNIQTHLESLTHYLEVKADQKTSEVYFDSNFGQHIYLQRFESHGIVQIRDLWNCTLAEFKDGKLQWLSCSPNFEGVSGIYYKQGEWWVSYENAETTQVFYEEGYGPKSDLLSRTLSTIPTYALYRAATEGIAASLRVRHPVLKELLGMTVPALLCHTSKSEDTQAKCETMLTLALHRGGRTLLDAVSHKIFSSPEYLEAFETLPSNIQSLEEGEDDPLADFIEVPEKVTDT